MRVLVFAVLVAGCGRIGFDAVDDGARGDRPSLPRAVQTASITVGSVSVVTLPIKPTAPGTLLVIGSGMSDSSLSIDSISDDVGDVFTSVGARATLLTKDSIELWYAANGRGNATTIMVVSPASRSISNVWVLELAGIDTLAPLDVTASLSDAAASTMPAAATVIPITVPSAVVSVADVAGSVSGIAPASPFVALPIESGNNMAYYIATQPGTYGAVWTDASLDECGSVTAAFRGSR